MSLSNTSTNNNGRNSVPSERLWLRSELMGTQVITTDTGRRLGVVGEVVVDIDINEERLIELVYTDEKIPIEKNEKLKKIIFVKNKIINFVK